MTSCSRMGLESTVSQSSLRVRSCPPLLVCNAELYGRDRRAKQYRHVRGNNPGLWYIRIVSECSS